MGALRSFLLSYPEFLLAALCFLSLAALRRGVRARRQPGPVRWPVVGMLPFVLGNLGRLLDATTDALRECGLTFAFRGPWLSRADFLVTCDPAAVQHCLASSHARYDKGRDFAEMFDVVGDGLLVADAASWARQRHVAAAVFGDPAFRALVLSTMARQTARLLVPFLDHAAAADCVVEIEDVFMRYALDVSYASAFGADVDALSVAAAASGPVPPIGQATRVASEAALLRHIVPAWWWRLLRWLNVGAERRLAEAKAVLDEFVYREIANRKSTLAAVATGNEGQGGGSDLLSLYMAWPREPGVTDRQRDQFLRDSAVGYMFAAKDLIVAALTWLFYILCTHPHVEARILDELRSLRPTATVAAATTGAGEHAVFDADALQPASYLHAAVLETLRLFPPAPFEEKEAVAADVLPDGTEVAKGTRVIFCIYAMGRMEEIWGNDCHQFRPERWLSDNGRVRHEPSHKFAVFNCGPRSCLGKNLGLSNIKIAAAAILYNFQVELVDSHVVKPQNSVVLHTKNGMRVRIKRRKTA
ncbi:unnamed protein product [Urochloa decumbens]|uniref:Alkane hydroxylase MAH1-like n=1 Tax=Urochloa decumbens TaxID=240449 RepID=A0ABC9GP33_9POAL